MHTADRHHREASSADTLFACLGQAVLLVDRELRVRSVLGGLPGNPAPAPDELVGRPAEELFGNGLLEAGSPLRRALDGAVPQGGWIVTFAPPRHAPLLACLSTAPLPSRSSSPSPLPAAAHALLLRPFGSGDGAPFAVLGDTAARSAALRRVFRRVGELHRRREPVLLVGESGTGKELVARALHAASPRRGGPFVALGCGALPEKLVESELFGHVRGAFRGAAQDRPGGLEAAAGGILFLDEVGELPAAVQAGLLKALRQGSYRRLGEARPRRLDVRLVAACRRDPGRAVATGRFLPDLYGELARVVLRLPPLRQRPEDVEPLVALFLARASARDGVPWRLDAETLGLLLRHRWPGNAAELESVLEHACAVATPPRLASEDLPAGLLYDVTRPQPEAAVLMPAPPDAGGGLPAPAALKAALERHGWRRRETADALGIPRTRFWRHLQALGWSA